MAIYNKYPYTDFHELNLDWFLEEFTKVTDHVEDLDATVTQFTEFVTNYFDELDTQTLVNNRLNAMAADGTLSTLLEPLVTSPVTEWLDSHITQPTTPVIDDSLSISGAAADSQIVGQSLKTYNCFNFLATLTHSDQSGSDHSFTWTDKTHINVVANNNTATRIYDFIAQQTDISTLPFDPGDILEILFTSSNANVRFRMYFYDSNLTNIGSINVVNPILAKIPYNTKYVSMRIFIAANTIANMTFEPIVLPVRSNKELTKRLPYNFGDFTSGTNFTSIGIGSCDDITFNSTLFVSSVQGNPTLDKYPHRAGWLITTILGVTENSLKNQIAIPSDTSDQRIKFRTYRQGAWSNWVNVSDASTSLNTSARMFSVGNSIMTGSVWINGAYNHLCSADNSPYQIVGNAIGVANIDHVLVSSTGFLYDAGEGSLLDKILATDFSNYDCCLAQLSRQDLANFTQTEILAGISQAISHIQTDNLNCQFILVSVPPVNYAAGYSGSDVFTGVYAGGSSISSIDAAIYADIAGRTSDKYIYADWQAWNISYMYQSLTDGNNVHANNDQTYREMGAYIAGRIASQIHF